MHCTAVGKAVLAFLPYERVRAIIAEAGMETYTDNTVSSEQELFAELKKIRSRGFATDNLEHNSWTYCVGAPIFNRRGEVFASCSVAGREPETVGAELEALSAAVRYTAQEISVRMGYVPRGERLIWRDAGNPLEPV
jgi:DNA-binding IclR family transcriptional regulator